MLALTRSDPKRVQQKFLMMPERCPPFCNQDTCTIQHHLLIVSLVNIDENDDSSFEYFKATLAHFSSSIKPGQCIPDPYKEYRYPVLHWASVLGKVNAVKFLTNNGYHPTIKSQEKGETALHRVVLCLHSFLQYSSQDEVIEKFRTLTELLAPALVVKDDNGNTPCHNCAILCNQTCDNALVALHRKAFEIMIDNVIEMSTNGLLPENALNIRNRDKKTVLHILSAGRSEGWLSFMRKLLDNGADEEMRDFEGKTPMDIAKDVQNRQLYKEMKHKRNKRHHCESSNVCYGMPVEKKAMIVHEHNMVTSTTQKDGFDENQRDVRRTSDQSYHRRRPNHEIRPSLVTCSTFNKSRNEATDVVVSAGPSSSTHLSSQEKNGKGNVGSGDTNRTKYKNSDDYSQNHERLTLGELLNNVDMGEFILSTVETKQQELEAVCLNLTTEQQELSQKKEEVQVLHEQISDKIRQKKVELEKLNDNLRDCENVLINVDEEWQKLEERRLEKSKTLENYARIIEHMHSVEHEK